MYSEALPRAEKMALQLVFLSFSTCDLKQKYLNVSFGIVKGLLSHKVLS